MGGRMMFLAYGESPQVSFLGFGKTALVRVEDREIIQHRRDVGMFRAELFLVNLEGMEVIRLGRFLPPGLSIDERDVVQDRAEIGIGNVRQPRAGLERGLVITERSLGFPEIVANESQPSRGTKERALVRRLSFFEKGMRLYQIWLGGGAIARGVVELPNFFETEGVVRIARFKSALRQSERGLCDANRFWVPVARAQ